VNITNGKTLFVSKIDPATPSITTSFSGNVLIPSTKTLFVSDIDPASPSTDINISAGGEVDIHSTKFVNLQKIFFGAPGTLDLSPSSSQFATIGIGGSDKIVFVRATLVSDSESHSIFLHLDGNTLANSLSSNIFDSIGTFTAVTFSRSGSDIHIFGHRGVAMTNVQVFIEAFPGGNSDIDSITIP
jgi:hypothetical protein